MKKKNIICYSISIFLIISYFAILGLNFNIKAPIEYKLYYIKKDIAGWPGYGGMEIEFNKKKYLNKEAFKDEEIYKAVNKGMMRFEDGKRIHDVGEFYFTAPKDYLGDKIKVKICLKGLDKDNNIDVSLNGKTIDNIKTTEEYKDYYFIINEKDFNSEENIIKFTPSKYTNVKYIEFLKVK